MSDEPSKTVGDTMEETKDRHRRYLRAINNPVRRNILRSMKDGKDSLELIAGDVGLDANTVEWHMRMLIDGFCVELDSSGNKYALTQEGLVVDFLDK
jgi:predicted transcriptional regulator